MKYTGNVLEGQAFFNTQAHNDEKHPSGDFPPGPVVETLSFQYRGPPSSRDEGLRLLHGLETNLATSLQTPQEA